MVACVVLSSLFPSVAAADTQSSVNARSVERYVRAQFAKAPVLISIARCESGIRQYDENGNVLRNEQGSSAVGVMQIMSSYHKRDAARLGFDIYELEGNVGYALHLYRTQGTTPWNASRHCWNNA